MGTTFNFEVNSRPNRKGKYSVFIRVTQNRRKKKVKTSVELKRLSDWNKDKQKVRASDPDAAVLNAALATELERAQAVYRNLEAEGLATTANVIKRYKGSDQAQTLLAYSKKIREDLLASGKLGSWQKYGTFVNMLEGFLSEKWEVEDIVFKEVTPDFVAAFTAYLNTLENHRTKAHLKANGLEDDQAKCRLHPNTIAKLLKIFRAIVNKAINVEGYIKPENNPFRAVKIKEVPMAKESLEKSELEAIAALDLPEGSPKWHARNAFFFSMYCAGIRAGDCMQVRWCDISPAGRLSYHMGKNHKIKDIALVEPAKRILDQYRKAGQKATDYIFPYLDNRAAYAKAVSQEERDSMPVDLKQALFDDIHKKNIQINRRLKALTKQAGICKDISFHISRHTFARQAKLAGTDNALLKDMLNHSSLAITERYMGEFDTAAEDQALKNIFGQPASESQKADNATKEALLEQLKDLDAATLAEILKGLQGPRI